MMQWRILLASLLGLAAALPSSASVYGALYEVGNLTADTGNGLNYESILTYYHNEKEFVAITSNDGGETEWWTSDQYGLNWTRSTVNPLADYDCTQPGRHSIHTFQGEVYFGAQCADGAYIFKLTGTEAVSIEHINLLADNYPTTSIYDGKMYFFYDGGYTEFDGTTWTDVTTATNQPTGAPLEASRPYDGGIWLAFTSGEVMQFDGSAYTLMGDDYLEHITSTGGLEYNLPAVEAAFDTVYVGNQDFTNGATLFKHDALDDDSDGELWEEVTTLDPDNTIINKMQLTQNLSGDRYLVYFTANGTEGVNIFAMDQAETMTELIDAGLGGTDAAHNTEVIDVIGRNIVDSDATRHMLFFSTQNRTDETKIYAMIVGDSLAFTPYGGHILSAKNSNATVTEGQMLRVRIPARKVKKGDVYSLWVDGEKVMETTAKHKSSLLLKYKGAQNLASGTEFNIQVGRRISYGRGDNSLLSRNTVKGNEVTVIVE